MAYARAGLHASAKGLSRVAVTAVGAGVAGLLALTFVPAWRTGSLVTLIGLAAAAGGLAHYRVRVLRGALSRMWVVVERGARHGFSLGEFGFQPPLTPPDADKYLADRWEAEWRQADAAHGIALAARGLRATISDIVWCADPRRGSVADLIDRMRQSCATLASFVDANGVGLSFNCPTASAIEGFTIPSARRRHLLAIFKEAVANIERHTEASVVVVTLSVDRRRLTMLVVDNGWGFDTSDVQHGQGLRRMRERAAALGGTLAIDSGRDAATSVQLSVDL